MVPGVTGEAATAENFPGPGPVPVEPISRSPSESQSSELPLLEPLAVNGLTTAPERFASIGPAGVKEPTAPLTGPPLPHLLPRTVGPTSKVRGRPTPPPTPRRLGRLRHPPAPPPVGPEVLME